MSDPSKSRIAIKLGGSSTSTSRPSPRGSIPPSTLGKRARQTTIATAALGDESDSNSESEHHHHHNHNHGRHETITGFGQYGAETEHTTHADRPSKKQYVIAKQPNRDWRNEMKTQRRPKTLPEEAQHQQHDQKHKDHSLAATATTQKNQQMSPDDQDKNLKWGLTLPQDQKVEEDRGRTDGDDVNTDDKAFADQKQNQTQAPHSTSACSLETRPRTDDDEALDALLGNKKPSGPEKRIPAPSEDEVYKRDAASAGAASTLEDYEAMPVEEFGAALLRGMGWNGDATGPKVKEVRRRPNRLGLGAKELKDAEDLGGWNQMGHTAKAKTRPRLADYRREESRRKEERGREDSYKKERERERDRERGGDRRDRDRDRDRYRERDRDHRYRDERRDRDRDGHRDRRR
ncbi:hypothetical protein E4U21_001022 [Claviceps maximensis]|nr:hypothetical protein E4U21_001022 [Claviceps maximensis]